MTDTMAQIYCGNCGRLVNQNANFCAFCGAAIHGQAAAVYNHTRSHNNNQLHPNTPPPTHSTPVSIEPELAAKTVKRENVSSVAQILFGLHYLKTSGVIILLAAVVAIVEPVIGITIAVGYMIILIIITHMIWSSYFFSIDETHFHKQYGILHKKSVTIPFERIQNVNITRSLVDQIFGLASLDIETAGSSMKSQQSIVGGRFSKAEGYLTGLDFNRAKEIHDVLLQKVNIQKQRW